MTSVVGAPAASAGRLPLVARPSTLALRTAAALALGGLVAAGHALWVRAVDGPRQAQARALVRALDLTDATWFTAARYTRHAAMADGFAAFQDGPGLPEHFPAGSWVPPPRQFPPAGLRPPRGPGARDAPDSPAAPGASAAPGAPGAPGAAALPEATVPATPR